jgi:two-component sensor histidine kinase
MSLEDVRLNLDTAIPCGLIVQELLSNCFKHAFPGDRAGDIRLTLRAALCDGVGRGPQALGATASAQGEALPQETYMLSVSDTGVGFPAGLDFRQTTSLGLQLVCLLTEQLDGTITLEHHHGTTFTITFAPVTSSVKI